MYHYMCYCLWVWEMRVECISDTLAWFPSTLVMQIVSSEDRAIVAAHDFTAALRRPALVSPIAPIDNVQREALRQLVDVFANR